MRRTLLALTVAACAAQASAANYAPVLWNYVQGKAPTKPLLDSSVQGNDVVMRMWMSPRDVPAEGIMTIYLPQLSTNHWMVALVNPKGTVGTFVGSGNLKFVKVLTSQKRPGQKMNLYEIYGGMFDGLYAVEGNIKEDNGKMGRLVMLLTPQVVADEGSPQDFVKR